MMAKAMGLVALLTATMALPCPEVLAGEALPPRALARIGDHRFYHGSWLTSAALSPDGRRIASAAYGLSNDKEGDAYDRTIVLWDAATGERLREMRVPHNGIHLLAYSPDGKCLAADYRISDEVSGVAIFEVETGKLLRRLEKFKSSATSLQFSSDGKQLHVSEWRGPVSAWDAATGKQLHLWKPLPDEADGADKKQLSPLMGTLSPDGRVIAWEMGSPQDFTVASLRVHNAATEKLLFLENVKTPLRPFVRFSADSKRLAAFCRNKLLVWDTLTGKELATLEVPTTDISYLASNEEEWRELLAEYLGFALSPDGRHAVICEWGSRLRLWDLENGKPTRDISSGFARLGYYSLSESQVFSASGKTLLAATDTTLRLFDTTIAKDCTDPSHRAPVTPRFSADGCSLFTFCVERRCCWDVSGKRPRLLKHEPRNPWVIDCLAHSADNRLFLDFIKERVRVREMATGRVLRELEWKHWPDAGLFSPDASRVLLWYDSNEGDAKSRMKVRLYEVKRGQASKTFKPVALVGEPIFSPNGRFVAWEDNSKYIHLYDVKNGKTVRTLRSSRPFSQAKVDDTHLLFSPDGERVIVTSYIYEKPGIEEWCVLPTRVFQVSSGREIACFYANPKDKNKAGLLSCTACSPDARLLAVAGGDYGTIRLLEIASGKVRVEFTGHRHGVHALAFSPDGKTLASGGEDNVVFLWDVTGARTSAVKPPRDSDLPSLWNDLASYDGQRAGLAIASFLRKPEASVAFLQERLHPAETIDKKRLARLIADLDSAAFETREAASRELTRLGERVESALRRALRKRPSLEARRRIEDVLSKLEPCPPPSAETLRALRAIEVLEHIGTPTARRCLQKMAQGAADARPTRDAKAALQRLMKRQE